MLLESPPRPEATMLELSIHTLNGAISLRIGLSLLAMTMAGCAPDSVSNRQATGFNGYLDTLASSCRSLVIGPYDVGSWLMMRGSTDPNYSYFLDMTSRLYYGAVSQSDYRESVTGFLGPGSTNAQSFACIFANLPGARPAGSGGGM
jgi:hypothetical protein